MSDRHHEQEGRLLEMLAPGAVGAARLVVHGALLMAIELTPPTSGRWASDEAVLATFWDGMRVVPVPPPAPPAEPDCACGEPAVLHVWSAWARARTCSEAESGKMCGCYDYTPKETL